MVSLHDTNAILLPLFAGVDHSRDIPHSRRTRDWHVDRACMHNYPYRHLDANLREKYTMCHAKRAKRLTHWLVCAH